MAKALGPLLGGESGGIETLQKLTEYGLLLHDHASRLSLIAKGDRSTLYTRHVLDSLNPLALFDRPPTAAIDVGSGGGLPGLPLAMAWPATKVVLLEARSRKAGFLERAQRELGLKNVQVMCARLEDLSSAEIGPPPDAMLIRAVGDLLGVLANLRRVGAPGAHWVYFLGAATRQTDPSGVIARAGLPAEIAAGTFGGSLLHGFLGRELAHP